MKDIRFQSLIGLAGVDYRENARARRVGHLYDAPMLLIATWIIIEWYAEAQGSLSATFGYVTDLIIWLMFVSETLIITFLVDDKGRYLRGNWINLLIILVGIPIVWGVSHNLGTLRSLRLLLYLAILINLSDTIRQVLSRNHLGVTLLSAFIIIMMSGVLIAGIDPNIDTVWEGLWWAWVTVTTVGYGDIVPGSVLGKLFGALLILLGVALFTLLTASFSAFFISKDERKQKEDEKRTERQILERLSAIEKQLSKIETVLHSSEKK